MFLRKTVPLAENDEHRIVHKDLLCFLFRVSVAFRVLEVRLRLRTRWLRFLTGSCDEAIEVTAVRSSLSSKLVSRLGSAIRSTHSIDTIFVKVHVMKQLRLQQFATAYRLN